jgi:hypothetical protein
MSVYGVFSALLDEVAIAAQLGETSCAAPNKNGCTCSAKIFVHDWEDCKSSESWIVLAAAKRMRSHITGTYFRVELHENQGSIASQDESTESGQ